MGETFGESKGLTLAPGLWHLGNVGEVCTIIDLRWRVVAEGLRVALDNDNSFCNVNKKEFMKHVIINARKKKNTKVHSLLMLIS